MTGSGAFLAEDGNLFEGSWDNGKGDGTISNSKTIDGRSDGRMDTHPRGTYMDCRRAWWP